MNVNIPIKYVCRGCGWKWKEDRKGPFKVMALFAVPFLTTCPTCLEEADCAPRG